MTFILIVVIIALAFEYINGFHDTALAVATSVSTKVLNPRQAIFLAAVCNLGGAMVGVTVASTVGKGIVETGCITPHTILCALIGAIWWNLLTWWLGLPSSSSHALIGGLCGSALATAHNQWSCIRWSFLNPASGKMEGLLHKVVIPMFAAPVVGFVAGFVVMGLLTLMIHRLRPRTINVVFGRLQLLSAGWMGFSHGTNDAQKTMGIIALLLLTGTRSGSFDHLPAALSFLRTPEFTVAFWVKLICAATMAAGTAVGGWRIVRTLGSKVVRMQPVHGFAAQTTAASVIYFASLWGIPLSTTQVISTSIMGVGCNKRMSAVKWGMVGSILWAWVLTIPMAGVVAYGVQWLCIFAGLWDK